MTRATAIGLTALLLGCGAAGAAAAAALPPGCRAILTVRFENCLVAQYARCGGDETWRHILGPAGPVSTARMDGGGQTLELDMHLPALADRHEYKGVFDPVHVPGLVAYGADSYGYTVVYRNREPLRFEGTRRLTGERVTVDGHALRLVAHEFRVTLLPDRTSDPVVEREALLERHGLLLPWQAPAGAINWAPRPVGFAEPGDAGFAVDTPAAGCRVQGAAALRGGGVA
jgi:hypothetical protein